MDRKSKIKEKMRKSEMAKVKIHKVLYKFEAIMDLMEKTLDRMENGEINENFTNYGVILAKLLPELEKANIDEETTEYINRRLQAASKRMADIMKTYGILGDEDEEDE